jgi:hypothetical protein
MAPQHKKQATTWRVIAAKATGTSHALLGKECEDHFASEQLASDVHVLAVADGAGSAAQAGLGARTAVRAAISAAKREMQTGGFSRNEDAWIDVLSKALASARSAIDALPSQSLSESTDDAELPPLSRGTPLSDFATTLILAIVTHERLAILQVGDGMIVIESSRGEYSCPLLPDADGQYLNDTHFITDPNYAKFARTAAIPAAKVQGIALLTDGLYLLATDTQRHEPFVPFFKPLFTFASGPSAGQTELEAFLSSKRVCERTDDDKTLMLAVRVGDPVAGGDHG